MSVGVGAVAYRGTRLPVLLTAGLFTGLGVAGMHYTGMAALSVELHTHTTTGARGLPATDPPGPVPGARFSVVPPGSGRFLFMSQFLGRELVTRPIVLAMACPIPENRVCEDHALQWSSAYAADCAPRHATRRTRIPRPPVASAA
ncbi:MHYT domain-containing protein [Streptomyces sp. NPDC056399]|uniref:MHYT domain-containing protein n=1 Tax=Streptomyces sp. NPDC056399 TaxID=3345807 RepID=UPI0035DC3D8C